MPSSRLAHAQDVEKTHFWYFQVKKPLFEISSFSPQFQTESELVQSQLPAIKTGKKCLVLLWCEGYINDCGKIRKRFLSHIWLIEVLVLGLMNLADDSAINFLSRKIGLLPTACLRYSNSVLTPVTMCWNYYFFWYPTEFWGAKEIQFSRFHATR